MTGGSLLEWRKILETVVERNKETVNYRKEEKIEVGESRERGRK